MDYNIVRIYRLSKIKASTESSLMNNFGIIDDADLDDDQKEMK